MHLREPDGSGHLAYPRGPAGFHTFMLAIGPDERLQGIANGLEEKSSARIRAPMTKDEVLRLLGPPDDSRSAFNARDELVWDWRYCQIYGNSARFLVLFDVASGAAPTQPNYASVRVHVVANVCPCRADFLTI